MTTLSSLKTDNLKMLSFAISVFIALFIYANAFQDGKPSCKKYFLNSYLYLIFGVLIVGLVSSNKHVFQQSIKQYHLLFNFILTIILIVALNYMKSSLLYPKYVILSHFMWLGIMILLGTSVSPLIHFSQNTILFECLVITLSILIAMTSVTFMLEKYFDKNKKVLDNLGIALFVSLLAIIIFELAFIFMSYLNPKNYSPIINKRISYVVIVLFTLFLLYDTSRIIQRSKICTEDPKSINYPNYPKESLKIILDVLNIFVRLVGVRRR
tara:strand:- start:12918 stop:13721 length:804 start_codon:yes stop_codon:yes gene_type:complete